jgi:SAM-dependent methyltransferase
MDERLRIFRDLLAPLRPGRLADVACGHGKFALIANDLGWKVTAIDARTERMPLTPGIEWVQQDVRDFDPEGFDCIGLLGIVYHLDVQTQIALFRKLAGKLTIIDTHIARMEKVKRAGYRGVTFYEEDALTASIGNKESFWASEPELVRMLLVCGFRDVYVMKPWYRVDRTFFIAR